MSSLLQRAHALISSKPAILGALVIIPLASATKRAEAVFSFYGYTSGAVSITSSSGGSVSGTLSGTSGNPAHLSTSSPITVSATNWNDDGISTLRLTWTGNVNPSSFPVNNSTIDVNYDFIIGMPSGTTGGNIHWALNDTIGGEVLDASGTSAVTSAGDEIKGSLAMPVTSTLTGTWTSELDLSGWTGFSGDASFSISVPSATSVDLGEVAGVPEPASLGVLGLGAMGLLARRRRRA